MTQDDLKKKLEELNELCKTIPSGGDEKLTMYILTGLYDTREWLGELEARVKELEEKTK